jgi:hypothetical protein
LPNVRCHVLPNVRCHVLPNVRCHVRLGVLPSVRVGVHLRVELAVLPTLGIARGIGCNFDRSIQSHVVHRVRRRTVVRADVPNIGPCIRRQSFALRIEGIAPGIDGCSRLTVVGIS